MAAVFERTSSRLIEMQSAEYLAGEHAGDGEPSRDIAP
jgi:predicted ATPase